MTDFVATSMNQDSYVSVHGESTPLSRLATSSYRAPMDEGCGEYTKEANQYLANYYEDRELIKADKSETLKLSVFKRIKEKWVSIKIVNREKLSFESEMFFIQEINVLKDLFHPNIIQLIDCVIYPNSYSVVYEHFSGEDLQQKIANRKSYNELVARNWIQGIFDAVKFCHQRNIVHRLVFLLFLLFYLILMDFPVIFVRKISFLPIRMMKVLLSLLISVVR
jgi:serine/threonine protein kinase